MRVSSVTLLPSSGALKSTRTSSRRCLNWMSRIVFLFMVDACFLISDGRLLMVDFQSAIYHPQFFLADARFEHVWRFFKQPLGQAQRERRIFAPVILGGQQLL